MTHWRILLLLAAWAICAAIGTGSMIHYELTPGERRCAPSHWPAGSQIQTDPARPTLLLFLHPQCGCSRATLAETQRLIADCDGQLALRVVFPRPLGASDDWEQTDVYRAALQIPAVRVHRDLNGAEARRFGAMTSGECLLYASDGQLLFHGGMTASRGHEGDNAGRSALRSLIKTGSADCRETPVFGCSLVDQSDTSSASYHATTD
jgi:hypothetical protein